MGGCWLQNFQRIVGDRQPIHRHRVHGSAAMRVLEIMDLDIAKVLGAWTLGVGNWMLKIDTVLHITVSCLSIVYISLKILEWYKKDK